MGECPGTRKKVAGAKPGAKKGTQLTISIPNFAFQPTTSTILLLVVNHHFFVIVFVCPDVYIAIAMKNAPATLFPAGLKNDARR